MKSPLGTLDGPEIVIGLVGRIGVDMGMVAEAIETTLSLFNYSCHRIKITRQIPRISELPKIEDEPAEKYYSSRISACNKLREIAERNDILSCLAIMKIRDLRAESSKTVNSTAQSNPDSPEDIPLPRTAFIVDQIKRPEEAQLLRQVYRDLFIQVSCHASREFRERKLSKRIVSTHPEMSREDQWRPVVSKLILQDDDEEDVPSGQRVRDAFPLADIIIDASDEELIKRQLKRFFDVLFGNPTKSPTADEYAMALAYQTSLRSIDMSRQVGAAIIGKDGMVLGLGCNEVPKAGGGVYSEGDTADARDAALGEDENTRRKRQMVIDVVVKLSKRGLAENRFATDPVEKLEAELLDRIDAPLKNSLILDSLEFGRMLHAELHALSEASRLGVSAQDASLICTTFPCHNCAKHIVGFGIIRVIYLQPYPKSQASELYPDSIEIDQHSGSANKIQFLQFIGITPVRYYLFEKSKSKMGDGRIRKWKEGEASPVTTHVISTHPDLEKFALSKLSQFLGKIEPKA